MTTAISIRGRVSRIPSAAKQRAERVAQLAEMYAPHVEADREARAERMAGKNREATNLPNLRHQLEELPVEPADDCLAPDVEAANAELRSNGTEVQREPSEPDAIHLTPQRVDDFISRPDARPMKRSDVANVQPIDHVAAEVILKAARKVNPGRYRAIKARMEDQWKMLLNERERVILTAMAWRKLEREESAT